MATKLPAATKLAAAKLPGVTFLVVWLCVVCRCVISAVFFFVGDCVNQSLSQQVKMDEIAKRFLMPTLQKETKKGSVMIFTRENMDRV